MPGCQWGDRLDGRRGQPATNGAVRARISRRAMLARGFAIWPVSLLVACNRSKEPPPDRPPAVTAQAPSPTVIAPQRISTPAPAAVKASATATAIRHRAPEDEAEPLLDAMDVLVEAAQELPQEQPEIFEMMFALGQYKQLRNLGDRRGELMPERPGRYRHTLLSIWE